MDDHEQSAEQLFLRYLDQIEALLRIVARRYSFRGDEPEDFSSWVKLKIIEDDYAVLRKFRGEAQLRTYLTTVFVRLAKDWIIARRGKWRPSARAQRGGVSAVRLETLISFEGRSVEEAIEVVKRNFAAPESRADLQRMAEDLPQHPPRSHVSLEKVGEPSDDQRADGSALDSEREKQSAEVSQALGETLRGMAREDRLILEMHFGRGMTIASIARLLDTPQRPLYSRLTRRLKELRAGLESRGFGIEQVRELFGWAGDEVEVDFSVDLPGTGDESEQTAPDGSEAETLDLKKAEPVNGRPSSVPSPGRSGVRRRHR